MDSARAASDRFGPCKSFTNASDLLDEVQPDVVSVCTPDETHAELVRIALSKPTTRAVLCEKPLASTVEEAQAIAELATDKKIVLAVNYSRRYSPSFQKLRTEIRRGEYGRVQVVAGFYGKGIVHNGTHWIDLLQYLLDEPISGEQCHRASTQTSTPSAHFCSQSGIPAHLLATDSDAFTVFEMDLLGTKGRIQIQDGGHRIVRTRVIDSPLYEGHQNLGDGSVEQGCLKDAIFHSLSDTLECLKTPNRRPLCSAEDAISALHVAEATLQLLPTSTP
jgi:predicted dehydrogenase